MSNLRVRCIDPNRPLPIYKGHEVQALQNLTDKLWPVPIAAELMEKSEARVSANFSQVFRLEFQLKPWVLGVFQEHHLQRAIADGLEIPTPEYDNSADIDESPEVNMPDKLITTDGKFFCNFFSFLAIISPQKQTWKPLCQITTWTQRTKSGLTGSHVTCN